MRRQRWRLVRRTRHRLRPQRRELHIRRAFLGRIIGGGRMTIHYRPHASVDYDFERFACLNTERAYTRIAEAGRTVFGITFDEIRS